MDRFDLSMGNRIAKADAVRPSTTDRRANPAARLALLVSATGTAFIVGHDGSGGWPVVRVLLVVLLARLALRSMDHGSPARRAGTTFAAGCASTAVGVGIGVPHLVKAGLHPMTVAGVACFGAGLCLLLVGGRSLLHATRPWTRVLTAPALLAAIAISVLSLGQAIAATNVPRTPVGAATPADRGMTYVDVELGTVDGVSLSGWYIPSENGAAVALLHGAGSTRSSVLDHAEVLAGHGYGVLLFDARGHGRSGGRAMDFGWYGDEDTSAAVSYLLDRPEVDGERIAVVGLSMGGEEAIGAGAADLRIAAVVAEGATNRVADDKRWLPTQFGWRGSLQQGLDWLTYRTTDLLTTADPPISLREAAGRMAPRPVLLIGGGEMPDEVHAGRYIQGGSPETVDLWIVPGAGHTAALRLVPEEWDQRVTTFLDRALGDDSP